ncbi:MAG: hypothetical protein ABFS09_03195 [Thermodesulfobacteriota bacterium]
MPRQDRFDDDQKEFSDSNKSPDIWYKLRSAGGIATAVMVAVIGSIGSCVMNKQQTLSTRAQLYTELMSQRENAESAVRKDMFQQILSSFLTKQTGSECIIDQIDAELLRLELLSRNFHEMLDMEPLFLHVLLKIVREIPPLKEPSPPSPQDNKEEQLMPSRQDRLYGLWKRTSRSLWRQIPDDKRKEKFNVETDMMNWADFKKTMRQKRLERLMKIAKRITKKQIESLSSVQMRQRLIIDLSKTNQNVRPNEELGKEGDKKEGRNTSEFTMKIEGATRAFTVSVDHSYPDWNQVRVKVEVKKTKNEKKADQNGKDVHTAEFWLGYFDFPLAENTFLSGKERYAVVLDKIDRTKQEAHLSLLYFPASYAGLKEKSFYQQKLISTLLEQKSF